jgi:hypothetical protein
MQSAELIAIAASLLAFATAAWSSGIARAALRAGDRVGSHDEVLAAARAVLRSERNRLKIEINSNEVTV